MRLGEIQEVVMPGIHALLCRTKGVDGRDKPGHDDGESALPSPPFRVDKPRKGRTMDATTTPAPRGRRTNWLNVLTVVSAAILIGAEVFGAAFAGSWAIATLFELGGWAARVMDVILLGLGAVIMFRFVQNARRIEPFTE
jgi:hypothetical protein